MLNLLIIGQWFSDCFKKQNSAIWRSVFQENTNEQNKTKNSNISTSQNKASEAETFNLGKGVHLIFQNYKNFIEKSIVMNQPINNLTIYSRSLLFTEPIFVNLPTCKTLFITPKSILVALLQSFTDVCRVA